MLNNSALVAHNVAQLAIKLMIQLDAVNGGQF